MAASTIVTLRVIRLPRHGASCPIGIGVSCSADRQAFAKITSQGLFIEKLEEPLAFYPILVTKAQTIINQLQ